jgi:hypothetical protein
MFANPTCAAGSLAAGIPGCRVVSDNDPRAGAAAMTEFLTAHGAEPARTVASIRIFDRREQTRQLAGILADVRARRARHSQS